MSNVSLTPSGPPETIIAEVPAEQSQALAAALSRPADQQRAAVAEVVARYPRYLDAWAALGCLGRDPVERYAAFRVGYHRGLDTLRANGWRGSGYVRWAHDTNRGFLRSLLGLHRSAAEIGEADEEERCAQFLLQLDPSGVPAGE
ncbi:MAG: DUF3151 family protein [Acidimicrobiales bacterium]